MAQPTTTSRPFTVADLDHFPDDGNRYELLDGNVLVTPPPALRHQDVQQRLWRIFTEAGAYVLAAPVNVVVTDDTALQPDLCVWHDRFDLDGPAPTPDLVVEISSPSTRRRDLGGKHDRYAAEGIPEYWFADLDRRLVIVHVIGDAGYDAADTSPARSDAFDVTVEHDELWD